MQRSGDTPYKKTYIKAKSQELTSLSNTENFTEQKPQIEQKEEHVQPKPKINRALGYGGRIGGMRI